MLEEGQRNLKLELEPGLADLIYRLFKRFQPYAAFPGRSVDFVRQLLDEASRDSAVEAASLHATRVADVLAFQRETGLPERLLRDDLPLPHEQVLAEFRAAVLGQEAACQAAAGVVTALKTGLNDPRRPLGVLLFCGPTGVGKTEMAKALARYLFGAGGSEADRLVRLDMSEYAGYGAAQRLLMSADGGVSDFIKRVRRQPFAVVLFDEIEKAAPEVHDALLGVLDEGRLTDRFGRTTTFKQRRDRDDQQPRRRALGSDRLRSVGAAAVRADRDGARSGPSSSTASTPSSRSSRWRTKRSSPSRRRELEAIRQREGLTKANLRLSWTDGRRRAPRRRRLRRPLRRAAAAAGHRAAGRRPAVPAPGSKSPRRPTCADRSRSNFRFNRRTRSRGLESSVRLKRRSFVRGRGDEGLEGIERVEHVAGGDLAPAIRLVVQDGELESVEGFGQIVRQVGQVFEGADELDRREAFALTADPSPTRWNRPGRSGLVIAKIRPVMPRAGDFGVFAGDRIGQRLAGAGGLEVLVGFAGVRLRGRGDRLRRGRACPTAARASGRPTSRFAPRLPATFRRRSSRGRPESGSRTGRDTVLCALPNR